TASVTGTVTPTSMNILVDVGRTVATGTYNIFVTNPDMTVSSCTGCLTITTGTFPTITSLVPSSLPPGSQAQPITAIGTNFVSGATVTSHIGIAITASFV